MDFIVGQHERNIDDKGRLSLPVPFREKLGHKCFISHLKGTKCIGIWTEAEFNSTMERIQERVQSGEEGQDQLRLFAASTHKVEPDRSGRIMIPAVHREVAELGKEVLVCGAATRVEVWNPKNWVQLTEGIGESIQTWV